MSTRSKFLYNLKSAFIAQGISLITSFAISLLLPRILSVSGYGYWQLFLFYSSYIGIFYFGLCEGIYLENGGKTWATIDRSEIAAKCYLGFFMQAVIACGIVVYVLLFGDMEGRSFVLLSVAGMAVLSNTYGFLGTFFQALNETSLYSHATAVSRILFLVPLLGLMLLRCTDYRMYILGYLAAQGAACALSIWYARGILRAKPMPAHDALVSSVKSCKAGIPLLVSSYSSMIILGSIRWVSDARFGIEAFSTLSLGFTMANFFMLFVNQVSMVLFPALCMVGVRRARELFNPLLWGLTCTLPLIFLAYCPLALLIEVWLPSYAPSLEFLPFIIVLCVFNSMMDIAGTSFLKALRMERLLLVVNVCAAGLSLAVSCVGAWLFGSVYAMLLLVLVVVVARFLASLYLVGGVLFHHAGSGEPGGSVDKKPMVVVVLLAVVYLASATLGGPVVSLAVSGAAYALVLASQRASIASALKWLR
ncbi:lipopolysaccharide biosynthesis protein [Thermophilibacter sp.]